MCGTKEDMQYGGGSQYRRAHRQYKRGTPSLSTQEDVQYGSVKSSVQMKVHSTGLPKPLRGLLVVVFNWENDFHRPSNCNLDFIVLLLYPDRDGILSVCQFD